MSSTCRDLQKAPPDQGRSEELVGEHCHRRRVVDVGLWSRDKAGVRPVVEHRRPTWPQTQSGTENPENHVSGVFWQWRCGAQRVCQAWFGRGSCCVLGNHGTSVQSYPEKATRNVEATSVVVAAWRHPGTSSRTSGQIPARTQHQDPPPPRVLAWFGTCRLLVLQQSQTPSQGTPLQGHRWAVSRHRHCDRTRHTWWICRRNAMPCPTLVCVNAFMLKVITLSENRFLTKHFHWQKRISTSGTHSTNTDMTLQDTQVSLIATQCELSSLRLTRSDMLQIWIKILCKKFGQLWTIYSQPNWIFVTSFRIRLVHKTGFVISVLSTEPNKAFS